MTATSARRPSVKERAQSRSQLWRKVRIREGAEERARRFVGAHDGDALRAARQVLLQGCVCGGREVAFDEIEEELREIGAAGHNTGAVGKRFGRVKRG